MPIMAPTPKLVRPIGAEHALQPLLALLVLGEEHPQGLWWQKVELMVSTEASEASIGGWMSAQGWIGGKRSGESVPDGNCGEDPWASARSGTTCQASEGRVPGKALRALVRSGEPPRIRALGGRIMNKSGDLVSLLHLGGQLHHLDFADRDPAAGVVLLEGEVAQSLNRAGRGRGTRKATRR